MNGALTQPSSPNLSATLRLLQPSTTYSLDCPGPSMRDNTGHRSALPFPSTTLPPNPNDHTPPTTPANLSAYGFGDGAPRCKSRGPNPPTISMPNPIIRYDVYLNGVLEEVRFGSGGPVTAYGVFGENTIEVIATDTAGNASPPATTTIFLP